MSATDPHHPETLLNDILAYVEEADKLVADGKTVELVGLNVAVDNLCRRVLQLVPEQGREYAAELEHLHSRLDDLQKSMEKAKAAVSDSLTELEKRTRAAKAYLKKPGS